MALLEDRTGYAQVAPSPAVNLEEIREHEKKAVLEGLEMFREEHKKLVDAGIESEHAVNIVGLALFRHSWNLLRPRRKEYSND